MKRALIAAALLTGLVAPATAATTQWQGDLFIIAISETSVGVSCKAVNMAVGDFARGVFRPKSVPGNGTFDLLSWHFSRSSGQLVPTAPAGGALNGATGATVHTIFGSAGFATTNNVLAFAGVSPAAPVAATPTVAIQITINNIYTSGAPSGCNVTFRGTLAKRP